MVNKHVKGSIFSLLTKGFILFLIIVVLLTIILMVASDMFITERTAKIQEVNIGNYANNLSSGQYDKIRFDKVLGEDGYLEIVDVDSKEIVYSHGISKNNVYTDGEIDCIQTFNDYQNISCVTIETRDFGEVYVITRSNNESDEKQTEDYIMLDSNYSVISSTFLTEKTIFTQKEINYLTQEALTDYETTLYVYKYEFEDVDGNSYVAIVHEDLDSKVENFIAISNVVSLILVFLAITLVILLFVLYLNGKFKKPLKQLENAMLQCSEEKKSKIENFIGPAEIKQIGTSYNTMIDKLEASEQARKEMENNQRKVLADVSHDLKTPITVIQGYSKAILDDIVPEEKKKNYLDVIYKKSKQLDELINSIATFGKVEHPNFALKLEKINICEFIREYFAGKCGEIELSGNELAVSIPEEKYICNIDSYEFKRVLDNLIGNSIKYNASKKITIYIKLELVANSLALIIADDGIGFDSQIVDKIFDPFVVGDIARGDKGGSGLGLAICKKIISEHGGNISIKYPPDDGFKAQFIITIPFAFEE